MITQIQLFFLKLKITFLIFNNRYKYQILISFLVLQIILVMVYIFLLYNVQIYEYISVLVSYCLSQETLCVKRSADIAFNSTINLGSDASSDNSDGYNSPNPNTRTRARLTIHPSANNADSDSDSSISSLASLSSNNSIVIDRLTEGGTFPITLDNLSSILKFCKKYETINFEDILSDITSDISSNIDAVKKLENDFFISTTFKISVDQNQSKYLQNLDKIINETQNLTNPSESFLIVNELSTSMERIIAKNSSNFNPLELETLNQQFSKVNIIKNNLITLNEIHCNCLIRVNKKIHNISNFS